MIYVSGLEVLLLFGILAAILLWVAQSRGFFLLRETKEIPLTFKIVVIAFAIYIGMTMLVAPLFVHALQSFYSMGSLGERSIPLAASGWIQLSTMAIILLLLLLFSRAYQPSIFKRVWKDWSLPDAKPILQDFGMGVLTWFISFPLVIAIGQIADLLIYFFFGVEHYEQVAVRYLKMMLSSPPLLAVALFTILLAAPIIEEFLFRGCLQTFFKRHLGAKKAILLSSLCFAFFHFAPSQGIGNVSLLLALFCFAFFLGFIYERQGSLFASIGLHMTFNTVSALRILLLPES